LQRITFAIKASLLSIVLFSFLTPRVYADDDESEDEYQQVIVAEAFVEFHTGPGRGFPVFHIVERDQPLRLIKKKTQWFKVRSLKGHEGWVHEDEMQKTLLTKDENFKAGTSTQEEFTNRTWEYGVLGGDFGGATSLTLYGGWNFTQNLSTEFALSQALGNVSDIRYGNISLVHQAFPEWRVSPFVKLGAGVIQTKPFTTLIQTLDRTDEVVNVGLGIKTYVSRQYFVRLEYVNYTILTSRNDNDEVEEWKLGFSIFF